MKSEVINRFNLNIYKNKQAFKQEHAIQDYLTFFFFLSISVQAT
jgi:hypothetical protein